MTSAGGSEPADLGAGSQWFVYTNTRALSHFSERPSDDDVEILSIVAKEVAADFSGAFVVEADLETISADKPLHFLPGGIT